MWMLPLYLQVNQKSDYDMIIYSQSDYLIQGFDTNRVYPGSAGLGLNLKYGWKLLKNVVKF